MALAPPSANTARLEAALASWESGMLAGAVKAAKDRATLEQHRKDNPL
ncbi:hypothetical protein V7S57_02450 [Caulobacter sp. CCNWLY153]